MDACKASFGEDIVYKCKGYKSVRVQGIVDYLTETVDPNTGAYVVSNQPTVGIKDIDLPVRSEKGDECIVRDVTYIVIDRFEDGQAGTKLILQKKELE